jgi:hypothetical protein
MNLDSACRARAIAPAALLADNVKRIVDIVEGRSAEARTFLWSDMFDSLHNAVNDYYLVDGDLRGVWNQIPKSPTIVNWNSGKMTESMRFFSRLGFTQITSPYYDAGSTVGMRQWRHAMEGIEGMRGMMYTTWSADYRYLRPFAHYAWGAGPYIIHTPLDTAILRVGSRGDSVRIMATVLPDPFDPAERITSVTMTMEFIVGGDLAREEIPLVADTGNTWVGYSKREFIDPSLFEYHLTATSSASLVRVTPTYIIPTGTSHVAPGLMPAPSMMLTAAPNPFGNSTTVRFTLARPSDWELRLYDLLGNTLHTTGGHGSGEQRITLDGLNLPSGSYRLELRTPAGTETQAMYVVE